MNDSKYIIFNGMAGALPDFPIVFPCYIEHQQIRNLFSKFEPLSAGFVSFKDGLASCYGESRGLGIKSNPDEDSHLISKQFNLKA